VGSIAKRPDGRWRARYRDPGGQERAKHFDKKLDAERWLTTVEASKLRGAYVDPSDRTTVAQYARRWAVGRPHRPGTARRLDSQIRVHIEETAIGDRRLAALLPSDVQAWVTTLARDLAPATVRLQVTMLRSIYAAAVLDRLVGSSPVARVTLPRTERKRVVPLTIEQVRQLAAAVPPRCKAMVLAQAGLGLRLGELLALRQQDVDFLRRSARVEQQLDERTRQRVETKTPRSQRSVPLPAFVGEALAEHLRAYPPLPDGTLFSVKDSGRPYAHSGYSRIFRRTVSAIATFPAGTTTHDLRHHYASVLIAGGESVVAVAERLGHEDAAMVLKVYAHLMPDSEDRTRRVVDEAWSTGDTGVIRRAVGGSGADPTRTWEAP
jgi:integrase